MVRSGSTLQYNMIRLLVEKLGTGIGEGYFPENGLTAIDRKKRLQWEKEKTLHVIKTHEYYYLSSEEDFIRRLYIYRDIRDVALSVMNKWNYKGNKLFDVLDRAIANYYESKKDKNILWQKYEYVVGNIKSALYDQAGYLDLLPDELLLDMIVDECSIDSALRKTSKMKKGISNKIKMATKWHIRFLATMYDEDTLLHPDHISKNMGRIDAWKIGLSEDEIIQITDKYSDWLLDAGYSLT